MYIVSGDLWAGAEAQIFMLVKTLYSKLDVPVSVILLNHGELEERLRSLGLPVYVFCEKELNILQLLRAIHQTITTQAPDVIHTHRIKENILVSLLGIFTGAPPSLRTAHGAPEHPPSINQPVKRAIHFFHWFCGRFIQRRVIVVSEDLASILRKDFPPEHIRVIENGIDLESFKDHRNDDRITGVTRTKISVGIAGRLVPVKRVDLFIRTARYIMDNYPDRNVMFHIIGDGPLYGELRALSEELETTETVVFEGHRKDILDRLQELDALLMTSDHEGLPMVLLEAMALQVPIIAHAVGGIPSLLKQGSCGILVQKQTAAEYARAIIRLADSKETQVAIKREALEQVTLNYSAEQNARAYLSEYVEISARHT